MAHKCCRWLPCRRPGTQTPKTRVRIYPCGPRSTGSRSLEVPFRGRLNLETCCLACHTAVQCREALLSSPKPRCVSVGLDCECNDNLQMTETGSNCPLLTATAGLVYEELGCLLRVQSRTVESERTQSRGNTAPEIGIRTYWLFSSFFWHLQIAL